MSGRKGATTIGEARATAGFRELTRADKRALVRLTRLDDGHWPLFSHGHRWFRICGYGVRYTRHGGGAVTYTEQKHGRRRRLHIGEHCFMVVTRYGR